MKELTKNERMALMKVFKNLCKCDLFIGKYDAKNGNPNFMYGIATVMENLAYLISENVGQTYHTTFTNNLIKSENKVKKSRFTLNKEDSVADARNKKFWNEYYDRIEQDGSEGSRNSDFGNADGWY